jgi:signal transduction histidine kinase
VDFQGFDGGRKQAHRGPRAGRAAYEGGTAGIVAPGGILQTEQGSDSVPNSETQTGPGTARLRLPLRGRLGLSGKLLLLTIPLVLILEVLIYVPSIANFYVNRLNDRLAAATTAALVLDAAPSGMVPDSLSRQILESIGARAVAIKTGQQRRLLAIADMPPAVDRNVDLRTMTAWSAIADALQVMLDRHDEVMRVVGPSPQGGQFIEVVVNEAPLRKAMYRFSRNVLLLSLGFAIVTSALIYLALHFLFVRPMRRMTANLVAFHENPESAARIVIPSRRQDEIGVAERELADMQRDLVSMLHQKSRLAALGLAVSKINHDLRNLLASSQLLSDQLASVPDPRVQRFAPKLMRSLERAIAFCQSTLSYGKAQEAPPDRRMIAIEPIANEVRESVGLATDDSIVWINAIERGLVADADPDQLFRVLLNLVRNAAQAMESHAGSDMSPKQIRIAGRREGSVTIIEVSDTGPGVPLKAREHLFEAFQGSARAGGTGLGLAIAAELVRAHGGELNLVEGTIGATFRITIPDRPVELSHLRIERARA